MWVRILLGIARPALEWLAMEVLQGGKAPPIVLHRVRYRGEEWEIVLDLRKAGQT